MPFKRVAVSIELHVAGYAFERPKYEDYSTDVKRILREILKDQGIGFHSIESRAKELESFKRKIQKTSDDGGPKYADPLKEITDLAAVRVIVFTTSFVQTVCDVIEQNFAVTWKKDVGEERSDTKDFGYQSVHYLVNHTEDRLRLQDSKRFTGMICEIQVRTILQHAWAEIEHDIQYKSESEIPKEIRRKFRALGGLIEIADREFQSVQDIDLALKDAIQKSAVNDLTKDAMITLEAKAADHNIIGAVEDADPKVANPADQFASAREYIIDGKYEKALEAFSHNIEISPNWHTQYLGRAKVRFLLGDRSGALLDIQEAERREPNDPAIQIIREQIEQGTVNVSNVRRKSQNSTEAGKIGNEIVKSGNRALSEGRGEEAFIKFSEAEDLGYNFAFSTFSKAMACVLVGDIRGAHSFLDNLRRIPGTPMEINIVALSCIIDLIENPDVESKVSELKNLLEMKPEFDLTLSPLKHLKCGIEIRQGPGANHIRNVFDLLGTPK